MNEAYKEHGNSASTLLEAIATDWRPAIILLEVALCCGFQCIKRAASTQSQSQGLKFGASAPSRSAWALSGCHGSARDLGSAAASRSDWCRLGRQQQRSCPFGKRASTPYIHGLLLYKQATATALSTSILPGVASSRLTTSSINYFAPLLQQLHLVGSIIYIRAHYSSP
jgi:hypothetical protein